MKNIQLTTEQALELYKTNPEYRNTLLSVFTDEELNIKPVLRDWEDLNFSNTYYPEYNGNITLQNIVLFNKALNLNVPSKKHAKSMIAFAKLSMLMNDLGDKCRVDWTLGDDKFIIYKTGKNLGTGATSTNYQFLSFKTRSIRDAFFEKHQDLIKEYFML